MEKMNDVMKVWRWNGFRVKLGYIGTNKVHYQFFDGKELIFEGKDFRPSPMHGIDSLESVYTLLGFLTCRPGDTDPDYFKEHTARQLDWVKSDRADSLRLRCYDYEARR